MMMKKALLFFILAVGVNSSMLLFSQPYLSESWFSLGFEYGNYIAEYIDGNNKEVESVTATAGINFGGYRFNHGSNFGIFAHGLLSFPVINYVITNGVGARINSGDYILSMQTGLIIGPGFRLALDERLNYQFAIGVSFLGTFISYTKPVAGKGEALFMDELWSFGIGGDMGIKFNLTDTVFLSAGGIFTIDFLGYISRDRPNDSEDYSGWAKEFFMIGARAYLVIGMNLFWK